MELNAKPGARPHDRAPRFSGAVWALALVLVMLGSLQGPGPASAQSAEDQEERLREVERAIREGRERQEALDRRAREIAEQLQETRERLRRHAAQVSELEAALAVTEGELAQLVPEEREKSAAFGAEQRRLARVLSTLQRLRRLPRAAVAAMPGGPNTAVRTVLALRAVIPHLERQARGLREELAELTSLRRSIEERRDSARALRDALDGERQQIAALLDQRAALLEQTEAEKAAVADRLERLREEAGSMRELVDRLETERRVEERSRMAALTRPSALRSFAEARGRITMPTVGRIVTRFGDDGPYGQLSQGIEIAGRAGAQVVAPFDGQVVFAGPFRSYGRILIIEHSDGYHSLVAGLSSIDVSVQQWVLAGEPIGAVDTGADAPRVYLELRHRGRPINPLPWMAAEADRDNG